MSNKTYDTIKLVALMCVPLVTLLTSLSEVWGYQYGAQIAATVSAVGIFLGAAVKMLSDNYRKEQK